MTHEAIQANYPSNEGDPVSLRLSQESSVFAEQQVFLGVLATDLVVAVGVASTEEKKLVVIENFLVNVDRATPHMSEMDRREFAHHLVETAEGRVRTNTAAALKAQNEALLTNHEMIKQVLMHEPPEVLLKVAPYLKKPSTVQIDRSEFTSEIIMPTTAELEEQLTNLTEETRSPARGITIARTAIRQIGVMYDGVVGSVRHALHSNYPAPNDAVSDKQLENTKS